MRSLFRFALLGLVMMLGVGALAGRASAQEEPIDQAGPLGVPYTGRDLASFIRNVGLNHEQAATARTLHQGYRAAFMTATASVRKKDEEIAAKIRDGNGDWSTYNKDRSKLTMQYVDEIRGLEK